MRYREDELDGFWNALVTGETPQPESPETTLVSRLASVEGASPRMGFLDELWTQMLVTESNGHRDEPLPAGEVGPNAPVALLPARPVVDSRSRLQRWGKLAAAIAALLAVAAVGAWLALSRQQAGPTPAGQPWSMTGGNPGKTNANPAGSPITNPTVQWKTDTNGRIEAAPVVLDGTLYIGNGNNHFYAISIESGLITWDANLRKPITRSAAVSDGTVVVGTTTSLYALESATGNPRWQRDDLAPRSAPVIAGGSIFLVDADNRLRAVSIETGVDIWSSDPYSSSPAFAIDVANDRLIATTADGAIRAVSTVDGVSLWDSDPGLGALGTPLVDGGRVFVPIAGGVARIDGETGALVLKNELDPGEIPSLTLTRSQLIASTETTVAAFDRDTLQVQWATDVQWYGQPSTQLSAGLSAGSASIYALEENRTLTALDRTTGAGQWTLPLGEVAQMAPAVTDSALFVATRDGAVYAIGNGTTSVLAVPTISPGDEANLANVLWVSTGGADALRNPTGVAVSPSGELWVCDTANDRLQVFEANGKFLRNFGTHGSAPGEFDFGTEDAAMDGNTPLGHNCSLDFDASGALYVADAANQRVQRFPASALSWLASSCCTIEIEGTPYPFPESVAQPDLVIGSNGTGDGQFLFASDVAIAPNGDIYIGDRYRIDVQRFDHGGHYIETIGEPNITDAGNQPIVLTGIGDSLLEDPLDPNAFLSIDGIAIDQQGRLYIADDKPQTVVRLEPDGSWTTFQLSRRDYRINGIAVDDRGNIFVAQIETIGGGFTIYDPTGHPLGQVGKYGDAPGEFDGSSGLALDGNGNIYVTDWAANRVQKFALDYEQIDASSSEADS
jgi:outer membrane protein assembly factor BamB